jgi:multiple sugar transport system ATP-binding protein
MAVVKLDRITKRYDADGPPAVDSVSLTIADGEFMVLLGPSGCGKSTTLRMIAGLETITDGELAIDDTVINNVPAKDRDIAMVFQSYALYPHMNVRNNLAFGLRRRGFDRHEIQRRVEDAARILELTDYLDRKPFALSGGQRQRVALGRAIVRDPKVFLLDEPLSNLDAALRVSTRGELIKQHRRLGTTMIYVTHDQVEAMTMGSRICIMNGGRIAQVGRPMDVYSYPADTFVARFLGSPGMNLISATVASADGVQVLKLGEANLLLPTEAPSQALGDGAAVLVGIRPEDFYDTRNLRPTTRSCPLKSKVSAVEPLGADTLVLVQIAGTDNEVMARLGRDVEVAAGDILELHVDLDAVRLFEPDTGRALMAKPNGTTGAD